MICKKCMMKVDDNLNSCPSCGSRLKKKSLSLFSIKLLIMVVLVLLIGWVSLNLNSNTKDLRLDIFFDVLGSDNVDEDDAEKFFYTMFSEKIVERSVDDYYEDNFTTGSLFVDLIVDISFDDYKESIFDKGITMSKVALDSIRNNSMDYYGDNMKISYKIVSSEKLSSDEIEEIFNYYKDTYPTFSYSFKLKDIDKAKKMIVEYVVKGDKNEHKKNINVKMYHVSGDEWHIDERILDEILLSK